MQSVKEFARKVTQHPAAATRHEPLEAKTTPPRLSQTGTSASVITQQNPLVRNEVVPDQWHCMAGVGADSWQ